MAQGGHRLRILDDLSAGRVEDLAPARTAVSEGSPPPWDPDQIGILVADVRDEGAVMAAAEGADVIVHLAANTGVLPSVRDPRADCTINVLGTLNALEAARHQGARSFVLASSSAALGEQAPPIHEELVARPLSPYGASKLAGEAYCSVYAGSFGLTTAALRFGNVYGPGSLHKGSVIPLFIRQSLAGETVTVFGDGAQTRDFIYVDDLVEAVVAATQLTRGAEVFQIATHKETTVNEIVALLTAELEAQAGVRPRVEHAGARPSEVRRSFSDISKARAMLGWAPRHDLAQGMAKTVAWFLAARGR